MERSKLNFFKNKLNEILEVEKANTFTSYERETKGDDADRSNDEKNKTMILKLNTRNNIYLKKVKKALDKVKDGTYGQCGECDSDIGENRLLARPTADLCIHCKEESEHSEGKYFSSKNRTSSVFEVAKVLHLNVAKNQNEWSAEASDIINGRDESLYKDAVDF